MASEVQRFTEAAQRVAEALTLGSYALHAAGFVDAAGIKSGSDHGVTPNQMSRFGVTGLLISLASSARPLTEADAVFVSRMLGSFVPGTATPDQARVWLGRLEVGSRSQLAGLEDVYEEIVLALRANGDAENAQLASEGLQALKAEFASGWSDPTQARPLPNQPAVSTEDYDSSLGSPATIETAIGSRSLTLPPAQGNASGCLALGALALALFVAYLGYMLGGGWGLAVGVIVGLIMYGAAAGPAA